MDKHNRFSKKEESNYQVSFRLTKEELLAIERESRELGVSVVEWLKYKIKERPSGPVSSLGEKRGGGKKIRVRRQQKPIDGQISLFERED